MLCFILKQRLLGYLTKWIPTGDILLGAMIKQAPWNLRWPETAWSVNTPRRLSTSLGDLSDHNRTKKSPILKWNRTNSIIALSSRKQFWFPISPLWVYNGLTPNPSPHPLWSSFKSQGFVHRNDVSWVLTEVNRIIHPLSFSRICIFIAVWISIFQLYKMATS